MLFRSARSQALDGYLPSEPPREGGTVYRRVGGRETERETKRETERETERGLGGLYLVLDLLLILLSFFQLGLQITDLAQVPGRLYTHHTQRESSH